MRRAETLSVSIPVSFERAWAFISNPENLHLWTVDFALAAPRREGELFKVETPRGPIDLFVRCERETGVIDFYFGRDNRYGCSPSRLLPSGDGVLYIFTQFEPDGAAAGLFERLVGNVKKEMEILHDRLTAPH